MINKNFYLNCCIHVILICLITFSSSIFATEENKVNSASYSFIQKAKQVGLIKPFKNTQQNINQIEFTVLVSRLLKLNKPSATMNKNQKLIFLTAEQSSKIPRWALNDYYYVAYSFEGISPNIFNIFDPYKAVSISEFIIFCNTYLNLNSDNNESESLSIKQLIDLGILDYKSSILNKKMVSQSLFKLALVKENSLWKQNSKKKNLFLSSFYPKNYKSTIDLNIATDYIWRGVSQVKPGDIALSGGIELKNNHYHYLGAWISNVNYSGSTYEFDLYTGFANSINVGKLSFDYDLGILYYTYPNATTNINFSESYIKLSHSNLQLSIYTLLKEKGFSFGDKKYIQLDSTINLNDNLSLNVLLGRYYKINSQNIDNYQLSLTQNNVTIGLDKLQKRKTYVFLSYSLEVK
tara:strand:- start:261 stop:1481 length:1221 start_codon:yes stop_codon:yes gene_type:complete